MPTHILANKIFKEVTDMNKQSKKRKTQTYIVKLRSEVLFLKYDNDHPDGEQYAYVGSATTSTFLLFNKAAMIGRLNCTCGSCDNEYYFFNHDSGYVIQVDVNDVFTDTCSVDQWKFKNRYLANDIGSEHVLIEAVENIMCAS